MRVLLPFSYIVSGEPLLVALLAEPVAVVRKSLLQRECLIIVPDVPYAVSDVARGFGPMQEHIPPFSYFDLSRCPAQPLGNTECSRECAETINCSVGHGPNTPPTRTSIRFQGTESYTSLLKSGESPTTQSGDFCATPLTEHFSSHLSTRPSKNSPQVLRLDKRALLNHNLTSRFTEGGAHGLYRHRYYPHVHQRPSGYS